jgi:hypothetical protein
MSDQGSRWRAMQAKKSPCEGWLHFLVGQKQNSRRLVILKSPYVANVFSLGVIYENVDIIHVFIEIYRIRY